MQATSEETASEDVASEEEASGEAASEEEASEEEAASWVFVLKVVGCQTSHWHWRRHHRRQQGSSGCVGGGMGSFTVAGKALASNGLACTIDLGRSEPCVPYSRSQYI